MSALAIVIARSKAVAPVTAMVTTAGIYPVSAPQGAAAPYIVVNLVDEPDEQLLAGAGGYFQSRVSVECVANSALAANDLGEAVKLLDLVKGTVGSHSGVDIAKADGDFSDASDDRSRFRRVMDFYVRWRT